MEKSWTELLRFMTWSDVVIERKIFGDKVHLHAEYIEGSKILLIKDNQTLNENLLNHDPKFSFNASVPYFVHHICDQILKVKLNTVIVIQVLSPHFAPVQYSFDYDEEERRYIVNLSQRMSKEGFLRFKSIFDEDFEDRIKKVLSGKRGPFNT